MYPSLTLRPQEQDEKQVSLYSSTIVEMDVFKVLQSTLADIKSRDLEYYNSMMQSLSEEDLKRLRKLVQTQEINSQKARRIIRVKRPQ